MTSLLVIGAGRMAEAIISGLVAKEKNRFSSITVSNASNMQRLDRLKRTYGVHVTQDAIGKAASHDVILLAAPPEAHDHLLEQLKEVIDHQLVLTVAAGVDPAYIEARLSTGTPVAWIMPNTAAGIGQSMSTFTCGKYVDNHHRIIIDYILSSIGESEELSAEKVHDLTAITGSAPAFLYAFALGLEEAAVNYGVNRKQARMLVIQMLKGSVSMLEHNGDPQLLMDQVASPGGSTAKGIEILNEQGFASILKEAVRATNNHARTHNE
ncbi:pyrroline-5-carboxylate reductase [Salipaludibacillus sp. LMS25]|jgi:pyrroline-5-carboxylate reductase|uniref:pyrroline-5-carboxylate reductase n=1 Tax=Salipaludibacillus sp. LMS25 TaxID=2924031 RepID=UPI0020D15B8D|nr:pyrroline-5-carboxylate reductase [Salipaludibacillus sp. LMS25]UTR15666.1 pyrroline-5-carboxylate reductase [Salipaludibacillus sp. LMS25]